MNYTLRGVFKPLSTGDREKNEVIYNDENEFFPRNANILQFRWLELHTSQHLE